MSFQCVVQWQCSYTALIAIPRLRQRGQVAKAEEHNGSQNAKSSTHVHGTSPGDPRLIITSTARSYLKTHTSPRRQCTQNDSHKWWTRQICPQTRKKKASDKIWAKLQQRGWEAEVEEHHIRVESNVPNSWAKPSKTDQRCRLRLQFGPNKNCPFLFILKQGRMIVKWKKIPKRN